MIFVRKVALILGLMAGATGAFAQTNTLDYAQARQVAEAALAAGDATAARGLAQALVQQQPDDFQMLMLLSVAETQLGNFESAAIASAQAFDAAVTDPQKLQAARFAAGAHFKANQLVRAEWWLRTAANFATSVQERELVEGEFRTARLRNPFTAKLSFSAAPSNNINDGSREREFVIGGLAFILSAQSRALSGMEFTADADLNYRLSNSTKQLTRVGVRLFGRTYALSGDAKAKAPNLSGSDFSLYVSELYLDHRRRIFPELGATAGEIMVGKNWYGGRPLWQYERLTLSQDFPIGQNANLTVKGFVEDETALALTNSDTFVRDVEVFYGQRMANRDVMIFSVGQRVSDAKFDPADYTALRANFDYQFAEKILETRLSMNLGFEQKDYERYGFVVDGRHDYSSSASATAVFEGLSYFGFSPSLTLEANRTTSNISRFSTEHFFARLGIESNF